MKVSVIIASKDEEKNIKKSINFWLNQDYKNYDIIVVDDSNDKTWDILKSFKSKKLRIFKGFKKGVSHARNYGLSKSKAEIIIFSDADHNAEPDKTMISDFVKCFQKDKDIEVVKTPYFPRKHDSVFKQTIVYMEHGVRLHANKHLPEAYRRRILGKKPFNEKMQYQEVRDFAERMIAKAKKVEVCNHPTEIDSVIPDWHRFVKRGMWYGSTLIAFTKAGKNYKPLLFTLFVNACLFSPILIFLHHVFLIPFFGMLLFNYIRYLVFIKIAFKQGKILEWFLAPWMFFVNYFLIFLGIFIGKKHSR